MLDCCTQTARVMANRLDELADAYMKNAKCDHCGIVHSGTVQFEIAETLRDVAGQWRSAILESVISRSPGKEHN